MLVDPRTRVASGLTGSLPISAIVPPCTIPCIPRKRSRPARGVALFALQELGRLLKTYHRSGYFRTKCVGTFAGSHAESIYISARQTQSVDQPQPYREKASYRKTKADRPE